jgi:hypothetical protein
VDAAARSHRRGKDASVYPTFDAELTQAFGEELDR